jgi:hypothetical protein
MAKEKNEISFEEVENGFIITQTTDFFKSTGEWEKTERKKFVSTTATGTRKIIKELTDKLKKEVEDNIPSMAG